MNPAPFFDPFLAARDGGRYDQYRWFRERAPAAWGRPPQRVFGDALYLFSHHAVTRGLAHPALLQAPETAEYRIIRDALKATPDFRMILAAVLFTDPPAHAVLRRPMSQAMTMASVQPRRAALQARAQSLLDACCRRKHFDLVADFASPYIVGALGDLMGLPLGDPLALKEETARLARALDLQHEDSPCSGHAPAAVALARRVERTLTTTKPHPDGLCMRFLELYEGGNWSREDLVTNLVFLLFAGQETAVDGLGNAVVSLARNPEAWRSLASGQVDSLDATDELLRYDPPLQYAATRIAAEPLTIAGIAIPANTAVVPVLASANRDPEAFPMPETVRLDRRPAASRTFGHGPHVCAGKHVARLEIAVALETVLAYLPPEAIDLDRTVERDLITFRGHRQIPVTPDSSDR
ncbi:cytochrome P450 [Thioalkalivibrio paradoxus]|uniref:Cytochrome P450 n=1 Tax=Thioalkalivibrio paradoxus ARh 1 TaxID=713585 RepID=W0DS64_9GAMM|nr:cytochrome P450 [Thioalkalivibrio paradoxus]AHE99818.1 hypothetical protein THITH_00850 [Thioalkalivibrio paradoxus ARh 1]